jgi:hypothetical protein
MININYSFTWKKNDYKFTEDTYQMLFRSGINALISTFNVHNFHVLQKTTMTS